MTSLHWTEYFKALGPTLIAIFIAYVAFQQWQVNRANLREKLFEKRFAVFKQTQTFLSSIFREAKASKEALEKFHDAPQVSRFLFGKDIQEYLISIQKRAFKLRMYQMKLKGIPVGEKRNKMYDQESDELTWLTDQLEFLFEKFEPYLGFEKHK